ncbi:hypothetical protein ACQ86N_11245 [Puia sp. P3]|uniref:hypothetical protein n=1 Tax=Puia sp. P3 TaxID=3423952 RepID=UPI003D67C294
MLLNGLVKVPMQFLILLLGVMVFAFYKYNPEPIFFNKSQITVLEHSKYKDSLAIVTAQYDALEQRRLGGDPAGDGKEVYKATVRRWLDDIGGDSNDTNYIFLRFVTDYLPKGACRAAHCRDIPCGMGFYLGYAELAVFVYDHRLSQALLARGLCGPENTGFRGCTPFSGGRSVWRWRSWPTIWETA